MPDTPQDQDALSPGDESEDVSDDLESVDTSDEAVLETGLARFALAIEATSEMRKAAEEDLEFLSGKQWPLEVVTERQIDMRPCLTVNRLPQQVQQVTNDQRQNRPSIKVAPVDSLATEDTADIIQGIIRHIEYNSNAETSYDTGGESAARGGFGYWRLLTDFVDSQSFDQEIFIKRIRNPMSVALDPYASEPDGSDTNWGFITEDLSPEEYKARYPKSKLAASTADWSAIGNNAPGWATSESCRVAEYFFKEYTDKKIHLLSTGETASDEEVEGRIARATESGIDSRIVQTRMTKVVTVKWYKITAVEVLEKTTWLGSFIPIIPVYGNELFVKGKLIVESVIRHAKDPQRMLNYWKSAATETIALAPRAPFIGAEGQFEGHENQWATANTKNHPYLEYKPKSLDGTPIGPPQRQSFEPAVQAISQASQGAAEDIEATTGVHAASLGAQSNEISGVAIQGRVTQTQISNYHFFDNMKRSIRHTGRCLVDLIPKVYDSARAARILKEDGTQEIKKINQTHKDPDTGKDVLYDLSVGRYDVTVDVGPSYATKRQEAVASMLDFSKAVPQVAQACSDLIAKNMDWPGAQEIADRLRKLLPPALQDDPSGKDLPPQAKAQMSQMQQMIQTLSQHLNEKTQIIETKQIETNNKKMQLEHDERIEIMKLKVQAEIALATLGSKSNIELLNHQIGEIETRLQMIGESVPIGADDPNFAQGSAGGNALQPGAPQPTGGQSPGQTLGANP